MTTITQPLTEDPRPSTLEVMNKPAPAKRRALARTQTGRTILGVIGTAGALGLWEFLSVSGVLSAQRCEVDQVVQVGETVAVIQTEGEDEGRSGGTEQRDPG